MSAYTCLIPLINNIDVTFYICLYSNPNWKHHSGKLDVKYIDDSAARSRTRSKRRQTLASKAHELVTMCGGEVFLKYVDENKCSWVYASDSLWDAYLTNGINRTDKEKLSRMDKDGPYYTSTAVRANLHTPTPTKTSPGDCNYAFINQENIPANRQELPHEDFDLAGETVPPASKRRLVMSLYGHDGGASTIVEPGPDLPGVGVTLQSATLSNTEVATAVMQSSVIGSVGLNTTQPMSILTEKEPETRCTTMNDPKVIIPNESSSSVTYTDNIPSWSVPFQMETGEEISLLVISDVSHPGEAPLISPCPESSQTILYEAPLVTETDMSVKTANNLDEPSKISSSPALDIVTQASVVSISAQTSNDTKLPAATTNDAGNVSHTAQTSASTATLSRSQRSTKRPMKRKKKSKRVAKMIQLHCLVCKVQYDENKDDPAHGRWIGCENEERCGSWAEARCVGWTDEQVDNEPYICPKCTG